MVRTATLDLNSRGSFVDDLNSKPGIVMCRDALLHRSHEIQPAFFDSEKKAFFSFFFFFFFSQVFRMCVAPAEGPCAYFLCKMRVLVCYYVVSVRSTGGSSAVEQWTVKCNAQLSIGREFKSPSPEFFYLFFVSI